MAPELIWKYMGQEKFCLKFSGDNFQKLDILKALFWNMVRTYPNVSIYSRAPEIVTPDKVAEVSVTMLNMKGLVIYPIHLTTAVKFTIVPDLHQMDIGLHHHK